ncbi:MAG: glycosyltransferase family 4 protein [Clostridiales bacterium]|nr:glycosyltransferase family 4 protein [Clostridiales bacterium]
MKVVIEDGLTLKRKGGIGRYSRFLIDGLQQMGLTPVVPSKPSLAQGRSLNRAMYLVWLNTFFPLRWSTQGEVVHFTNYVVPCWKPAKIPWVVTIHDLAVWKIPDTFPSIYVKYLRTAIRKALEKGDFFIVVSKAVGRELLDTFPFFNEENLVHIPNAVHPIFLENWRTPAERLSIRQGLGLPTDSLVLLYVGTLEARKGLPTLFRGVSLARERGLPVYLILAGNLGYGFQLPSPTSWWKHIPGPSDATLRDLYDAADGVVLPSRYEGFGLPIIEAMARGTAVLLSDIPVFREVAGELGIYFTSEDPEALAESIEKLATRSKNEAEGVSALLRTKALEYEPLKVLAKYVSLYEKVMKRGK